MHKKVTSVIETQQSVKWSQNLLRIVAYFALDKNLQNLNKMKIFTKTLMIMLDEKFIAEKVLSEKTRADCFQGVEEYLKKQENYVEFTRTYNHIDEEIKINDAKDYLMHLGVEYNV